jgi:phage baseplate assembly protein W
MGSINIDLNFTKEVEENTHLYKDLDIKFLGDDSSKSKYIAEHTDVEAISQGLHNLFTWSKGERILLPSFGLNLKQYIYEGITSDLITQIETDIIKGVAKWEPRVSIVNINVIDGDTIDDPHALYIELYYKIPSINDAVINFNTVISNN